MHFKEAHHALESKSPGQAGVDREESGVCVCVLIGVARAEAQVRVYPEFHNRYPSASAIPGGWDTPAGICSDAENIVMVGTRSLGGTPSSIFFAQYEKASGSFVSDLEWPVAIDADKFEARVAAYDVSAVSNLARVIVACRGRPVNGTHYLPVTVCAYATPDGGLHLEWGGYVETDDEVPLGSIDPVSVSWDTEHNRVAVLCQRGPELGNNFNIYVHNSSTGRLLRRIVWSPPDESNTKPIGVGIDADGITVAGTHLVGTSATPRFMRFDLNGNLLESVFLTPPLGFTSNVRAANQGAEGYNATTFMCIAAEVRDTATEASYIQVATYRYEPPPIPSVMYVGTWDSLQGFVHHPEAVCALGAGVHGGEGYPLGVWVTGHTRTALGVPGDIFTVGFKEQNGSLVPDWSVVHDQGYPHHDEGKSIAFGHSASVGARLIVGGTVGTGSADRDYVLHFYDTQPASSLRHRAFALGPERDPLNPGPPYFNGPNDLAGRVFFQQNTAVFSGWSEHPTTSYDAISELYLVNE
jgi:hypothetical protein